MASTKAQTWRLTCCHCRKTIGTTADVYRMDGEWARRFPRDRGRIACTRCAMDTDWGTCDENGTFPPEHITPAHPTGVCDAWSHGSPATQRAAIMLDPHSGVLQGARAYVEVLAGRKGLSADLRPGVKSALMLQV